MQEIFCIAVKDQVKKELDRLVSEGVINTIEHSNYASPIILPVLKDSGQIK